MGHLVSLLKTGLSDIRRPFASFLFVGPTGVGKTHVAQLLADLEQVWSRPAEDGAPVARIYEPNGAVRDPRTGAQASRARDVWRGRLDVFFGRVAGGGVTKPLPGRAGRCYLGVSWR